MIKARNWSGKDLKGEWLVTIKIDGVRALYHFTAQQPQWLSRAGKPLYNLPHPFDLKGFKVPADGTLDVEVFCGSFKETVARTQASTKTLPVSQKQLYQLDPLDERLRGETITNPTAAQITDLLNRAVADGFEGLVLRQGDTWIKVKPTYTYDVEVTGIIEGTGKHAGRMGALMTPMGKVGTGFSDAERDEWWYLAEPDTPIGMLGRKLILALREKRTIEVECMHLTDDGKFRHPRFVRSRPDK